MILLAGHRGGDLNGMGFSRYIGPMVVGILLIGLFGFLLFYEHLFVLGTEAVPALDRDVQTNLYETAVASIVDQSNYFSIWALGLIAAGWFVLVHEGKGSHTPRYMFVAVCTAALLTLYFGQLLHQSVSIDIRDGQDPLFDPVIWSLASRQYWCVVAAAVILAAAIIWRHARGDVR
ncbi:MAG: hypothetical protein JWN70_6067 [Planctomycetaceae bacterium]|nr:hypothetical protein [Planctomycetaceae bacterium]